MTTDVALTTFQESVAVPLGEIPVGVSQAWITGTGTGAGVVAGAVVAGAVAGVVVVVVPPNGHMHELRIRGNKINENTMSNNLFFMRCLPPMK
jgi:hypothetical protein